jgi:hypothetical protein
MIRKFKALGLALVAVFAMSAVVASAASANLGTLQTYPAGATVDITAEQTVLHEFELTDHEVEPGKFATTTCKWAHFDGVGTETTGQTEVTIQPTYGKHVNPGDTCIAFGQPATITATGCDYLLKTGTPTGDGKGWHVTTDVVCSAANVIKIVTGTCEVHVMGQTGLNTSQVTNAGGPETAMDLQLHTNITGITYNVTKDGIGCPLKGTGHFKKGDYRGTTTVQATDSTTGLAVGITIH